MKKKPHRAAFQSFLENRFRGFAATDRGHHRIERESDELAARQHRLKTEPRKVRRRRAEHRDEFRAEGRSSRFVLVFGRFVDHLAGVRDPRHQVRAPFGEFRILLARSPLDDFAETVQPVEVSRRAAEEAAERRPEKPVVLFQVLAVFAGDACLLRIEPPRLDVVDALLDLLLGRFAVRAEKAEALAREIAHGHLPDFLVVDYGAFDAVTFVDRFRREDGSLSRAAQGSFERAVASLQRIRRKIIFALAALHRPAHRRLLVGLPLLFLVVVEHLLRDSRVGPAEEVCDAVPVHRESDHGRVAFFAPFLDRLREVLIGELVPVGVVVGQARPVPDEVVDRLVRIAVFRLERLVGRPKQILARPHTFRLLREIDRDHAGLSF